MQYIEGAWRALDLNRGLNSVLGKGVRQSYIKDIQSYQSMVSMKEFFANPAWIAVLLAGIALLAWLIKAFVDRKRPALGKEIEQSISVLRPEAETTPELILTYAGEAVWDAHMIVMKIKNTGNTPISVDDFEKSIIISTGGVDVLDAEVIDKTPDDLNPEVRTGNDDIEIIPLLLNPNDQFRLKILLRQPPNKLMVRSRIKTIKEITEIKDRSLKWIFRLGVSINVVLIWSILTFFKSNDIPILTNKFNRVFTAGILVVLVITFTYQMLEIYYNKRRRKS